MFITALAIAAFIAGFLGVAYFIASGVASAITLREERREKAQNSAEYWSLRTRSSYGAF